MAGKQASKQGTTARSRALTVRIPLDIYLRLKVAAARNEDGIKMQDLVAEALAKHLPKS